MKPEKKLLIPERVALYGLVRRNGGWAVVTAQVEKDQFSNLAVTDSNMRGVQVQHIANALEVIE